MMGLLFVKRLEFRIYAVFIECENSRLKAERQTFILPESLN
jgi:hypothetical protein